MAVNLRVNSTFSDKGTRKAKDSITGLDKHAKASFKRIAGYIAGAFAFTKIVGFVKNAIGAYFQQQKAVEGLRQALKTTNDATDANMESLQKVASALQVVTRVGDETSLEYMILAKNLGVATENLDEAATVAVTFNKAFGKDSRTVLEGFARAIRGNTSQMAEYIPELRGVTDANQAYNIIIGKSSALLREQAELGMTTAERARAIQAAWGDLTEELGAFIIESGLAEDVLDTMLFTIEDIQEVGFAKWFSDTFPALDGFIDRVVSLLKHLGMLQDYVEQEWMTPKSTEQKVRDVIGTPFVGETEADIASRMGKGKPNAEALERQSYADAAKVMQQLEAGAITLEQAIDQMPKNITIDVEKIPEENIPDLEISNIRELFIAMQRGTLKIEEAAEKFPEFIQIGEAPTLPEVEEQPELMGPAAPTDRQARAAQRRTERRIRREQREEEARRLIESLRGGRAKPDGEDEIIRPEGGQRLSAGELFERAYGAAATEKKAPLGTQSDPLYFILGNPEDISEGLA